MKGAILQLFTLTGWVVAGVSTFALILALAFFGRTARVSSVVKSSVEACDVA